MSRLYSIVDVTSDSCFSANLLILAGGIDERSFSLSKIISSNRNNINKVLLLKYEEFDDAPIRKAFPDAKITTINVTHDTLSFLVSLQECQANLKASEIIMDITAIRIPEMFMILKFLKISNHHYRLQVSYSTPIEYEFQDEPFTSYHSYYGNLVTTDLAGFGGTSDNMSHSQMVIFLGFEGVLSAKVSEDIKYDRLKLVNNLPSFFEKYKDISVINNYDLLNSRHDKMLFVPANNPFEVYNFLDNNIDDNESACAAPLSTKPVALGVCLYALEHENLRVVYPIAESYIPHRANSVFNTYLYEIDC